ncbi:hypothetical protein BAE44_0008482 [Dichanthelium oligosanthes]|uniref:Uncharacterized protein n=1 Tax=Dichanthelium oligosanthes TaxID=888268 RepID=A0A1E5VZD6_9POAL|nr:hypothetical protein BAE44_0008482 [Dichanthelium oligosanthes]
MDQSEPSESESDRHPSPSDCTITMPRSPSALASPRPPRRRLLPFRGRAAPEPGCPTASGSRNPDGESGNRPFATAALAAGGSRPLRPLLLPGHIHWEKRVRDMAIGGKGIKEFSGALDPVLTIDNYKPSQHLTVLFHVRCKVKLLSARTMDPNSAQNWNIPTNWRYFLMQDAGFGGNFPDFANAPNFEPQPEPPPEPQPGQPCTEPPKSISKGSKAPAKPKLSNFSQSEDRLLVSCWINVSTDPITANGQRKTSFWSRIEQAYNSKKSSEHPIRTLRSLESRWDFIKKHVTKFSSHHRQIQLEHRSGEAPCDEVVEAITRYNSLEKRPFAVAHCWAILKNEAKWLDMQDIRTEDNLGLGLDEASEGFPDAAESNDEGSRARKRPLGRDAAKEPRKRASSRSGSQGSEYVSKMSEMCLQRSSLGRLLMIRPTKG